jgi:hypothetical protein
MVGRPTSEHLEVVMTSPDQPVQAPEDAKEPSDKPQPPDRFFLSQHKSGWFWITVSVIAVVGVSAALIAVLIGTGTHQANLSGPSVGAAPGTTATSGGIPASRTLNGVTKPKGNVVSAAKLAEGGGAVSLPTSKQGPAVKWEAGRGGKDLAAVSRWFGDALQAGGIRQYWTMRYACAQLAGSVATADAGPKIPYPAMQMLYAKALAELAKGAADCRAAIASNPNGDESVHTHVDAALIKLSVSELAAGARDVFRSTAEIEIVSRQHP